MGRDLSLSAQTETNSPMGEQRQPAKGQTRDKFSHGQTETNSPLARERQILPMGEFDKFCPWEERVSLSAHWKSLSLSGPIGEFVSLRDKPPMGEFVSLLPWENLSLSAHGRICLCLPMRHLSLSENLSLVCQLARLSQVCPLASLSLSPIDEFVSLFPLASLSLSPMGEFVSLFPWENLSLSAHGRICLLSALWRGCLSLPFGEFVSVCPLASLSLSAHWRVCLSLCPLENLSLSAHWRICLSLPMGRICLCLPMGEFVSVCPWGGEFVSVCPLARLSLSAHWRVFSLSAHWRGCLSLPIGEFVSLCPWENLSLSSHGENLSLSAHGRICLLSALWRGCLCLPIGEFVSVCPLASLSLSAHWRVCLSLPRDLSLSPIGEFVSLFPLENLSLSSHWRICLSPPMGEFVSLFPWENLSLSAHGRICLLSALWRGCLRLIGEFVSVCPLASLSLSPIGEFVSLSAHWREFVSLCPWEKRVSPRQLAERFVSRLGRQRQTRQRADRDNLAKGQETNSPMALSNSAHGKRRICLCLPIGRERDKLVSVCPLGSLSLPIGEFVSRLPILGETNFDKFSHGRRETNSAHWRDKFSNLSPMGRERQILQWEERDKLANGQTETNSPTTENFVSVSHWTRVFSHVSHGRESQILPWRVCQRESAHWRQICLRDNLPIGLSPIGQRVLSIHGRICSVCPWERVCPWAERVC